MAMGIGYIVYSARIQSGPNDEPLPQQTSLTAVKRDLLSLGQAERLYQAANGRYGTVEELRQSGIVSIVPEGDRWGYAYTIEADSAENFIVTARPFDTGSGLPTLILDKTMQISQ